MEPEKAPSEKPSHFIRDIIESDLRSGKHRTVVTRFPPEPNGYLHIGHAKSICLNFGLARDYRGRCHLRFDDTNPETENEEFVESIKESVRWLGFDWNEHLYFASDYFERFYEVAEKLIRQGDAYVDSLSEEEIREHRGTVTSPGRPSPYRDRPVEENLDLFRRMRAGEFGDGAHVLRARGDLASPNMKMRDPLLYRIKHASHYHRGDAWCIYPFYDYAHPLEDAIEGVTHSLCTLEFDNNREVYDWVLERGLKPEQIPTRPRQYEFSRLNLDYTVMSKRKLLQLVNEGHVAGWDDPRLPTLFGMRRRGIPPEAIRAFCDRVGVTKVEGSVDPELLDHSIRDELNARAPRVMCVLQPLKVTITNYPEGEAEWLDAPYWPHDIGKSGSRRVPFSRELYIERDDFMETPSARFFRLAPGREVRLRYGYLVTCTEVVRDSGGAVSEIRCTYDPATRSGEAPDGRRPKATLHWVSAAHALKAEVRLYNPLFTVAHPDEEGGDFKDYLNPESLVVLEGARIEPSVGGDPADRRYQFERQGYFWPDPVDSGPERLVFNRIVPLRDTYSRGGREEAAQEASRKQAAGVGEMALVEKQRRISSFSEKANQRYIHYTDTLGLHLEEALVLVENASLAGLFDRLLSEGIPGRTAAAWLVHELPREYRSLSPEEMPFAPGRLAELLALVEQGAITTGIARDVLAELIRTGDDPAAIIERHGLQPLTDTSQLERLIDGVLASHPEKVRQYAEGKTGLMGFFVGQVMRKTGGRADPSQVKSLLEGRLAE